MANVSTTLKVSSAFKGPKDTGKIDLQMICLLSGKSAVKALLSPAFKKVKGVPRVEVEEDAKQLMSRMLPQ